MLRVHAACTRAHAAAMNMFGTNDESRDTKLDQISSYLEPDERWCAIQRSLPKCMSYAMLVIIYQ